MKYVLIALMMLPMYGKSQVSDTAGGIGAFNWIKIDSGISLLTVGSGKIHYDTVKTLLFCASKPTKKNPVQYCYVQEGFIIRERWSTVGYLNRNKRPIKKGIIVVPVDPY